MSAQTQARDQQIWDLYLLGVPKTRIAEQVGVHRNTVHQRLQQIEKEAAETTSPVTNQPNESGDRHLTADNLPDSPTKPATGTGE
jgi:hypothetical protein